MTDFNTLIFDLDGTLIDSAPGIINCMRHTLTAMKFDIPNDFNRFLGPPLHNSFAEFFGMNENQVNEAVKIFRERYKEKGLFENVVYDGIPEMLRRLKNADKKLLIATSKPEVFAVKIMENHQLAEYFDIIGGADINGSRNEKNEIIEYVLKQTNITELSRVLMIGDRSHDIIGAKKCGLSSMGVLWGYGNREEFLQHGADIIVNTPQETADVIINPSAYCTLT